MTTDHETSTSSVANLRAAWTRLSPHERIAFLAELKSGKLERWLHDWPQFSHRHQQPPAAAQGGGAWRTWLILGGRGAGKTRAGAQWVRALALGELPYAAAGGRIALIGESEHEVREVMIEGVSGLLAVHQPHERPMWIPSRRRVEWDNGTVAQAFSADDPESLRGPQFHAAWADELAKWRHADATFEVLQFGLRLGEHPRQVITTTPRPIALLKRLIADPATALTRAGTQANARHLSPAFLEHVLERYAGTRVGRQEIDGEIVEDRADALWSRALHRDLPRRCGAAAQAHRGGGRSAGLGGQGRRCLRAGGGRTRGGRHDLRDRRRDGRGLVARRLGRARRSRCGEGSRPMR